MGARAGSDAGLPPAFPEGHGERTGTGAPSGEALRPTARPPAFVLSGGGNLGALQVGMLYALIESGIRPGMIIGTSIGAANGAFLATRADLDGVSEIAQFWARLRPRDVLALNPVTLARALVRSTDHFIDSSPMRRLIESFVGIDRLEDAPIPLAVVAMELATREVVVLDSGDATHALLASAAIPGVLPPVQVDGRLLVDGAAVADIPVQEALRRGARDLYILPTARSQVARMLGSVATGLTPVAPGSEPAALHVVPPPDLHIPLADLGRSRQLLKLGYDRARAWLDRGEVAADPTIAGVGHSNPEHVALDACPGHGHGPGISRLLGRVDSPRR